MTVGLALVKFEHSNKQYLFKTPKFAHIEVGNFVKVEDTDDIATVVKYLSYIDTNEDDFDMIITATKATLPLKKILSVYHEQTFIYDKDEEDGADD